MTKPTRGAINELFALLKPFRLIVSASIVLGMLGGLSVTVLLATINNALHSDDGLTRTVVMIFAGLCALALLTTILSDIGTNYVGQHIIAKLRKELGEKVLSAPIDQIERYRSHRLIPVLTHDVDTISDFAANAGIVLGGRPVRPDALDLRWVGAMLFKNGVIEETGLAAAVLNHPGNGVAWLANKIAPHGEQLNAGEVILGGSFTRPATAVAGDNFHADYGPLGAVSFRFV